MIKKILFLFLTIQSAGASLVDLKEFLKNTANLSGQFEQTVFNSSGTSKSSGTVILNKPNQFFWHYQQPSEQKIIGAGEKVYFYDADLAQVTIHQQQDLMGNLAMDIFNQGHELEKNFTVKNNEKAPDYFPKPFANKEIYHLIPIKNDLEYSSIWLIVENKRLLAIVLETEQQKTILSFHNIKTNQIIKPETFQFIPPKGVDVVGT